MSDAVKVTTHGRVLVVTMDDGKVNALSRATIAELRAAIAEAEASDAIGAMLLVGGVKAFCAGFDLGVMRGDDTAAMAELVADGGDLVADLYGASVPVVAACTGHALAAGALMLLGCDLRLGVDTPCKIGLNEVAIGMVLPEWAFAIAQERLSPRHLARSIALATVTGPDVACDSGYLDETVPADSLVATALERAAELAELHPKAYGLTVQRMRGQLVADMRSSIVEDRRVGTIPNV